MRILSHHKNVYAILTDLDYLLNACSKRQRADKRNRSSRHHHHNQNKHREHLLRLCHLVRQEKYFKIDAFSEHTSAEGKEKMTSFVLLSSHPKEMIDKKINMDSSMICSQSNLKLDTRNR